MIKATLFKNNNNIIIFILLMLIIVFVLNPQIVFLEHKNRNPEVTEVFIEKTLQLVEVNDTLNNLKEKWYAYLYSLKISYNIAPTTWVKVLDDNIYFREILEQIIILLKNQEYPDEALIDTYKNILKEIPTDHNKGLLKTIVFYTIGITIIGIIIIAGIIGDS